MKKWIVKDLNLETSAFYGFFSTKEEAQKFANDNPVIERPKIEECKKWEGL